MAGTGYQSTDLLASFNLLAGRPTTDTVTDPNKYIYLAQAQDEVILEIANICGRVLYGAPVQMTTADGGYTYTFGTDANGYPLFLLDGHIYPYQNAVPSSPWVPGQDYLDEGITIRSLNYSPFTIAPWYYGIVTPALMSASVQPVIYPVRARLLVPILAVQRFAEAGRRDLALADRMADRWTKEWGTQSVAIRKHLRGRRLLAPLTSGPIGAITGSVSPGFLGSI